MANQGAKQEQEFQRRARRSLTVLQQEGMKVQVLGRIDACGKIQIDEQNLKELREKYPDMTMMFVALNSPFDPTPCVIE